MKSEIQGPDQITRLLKAEIDLKHDDSVSVLSAYNANTSAFHSGGRQAVADEVCTILRRGALCVASPCRFDLILASTCSSALKLRKLQQRTAVCR